MTEPVEIAPNTPTAKLGGREWPIPELAIRQLRACRRPIIDLTDALVPIVEKGPDGSAAIIASTGERVMQLSAEHFDQMCDVVYHGLTRAHPKLTREEFDALTATDSEVFLAFLIVRRQSGIFVDAPPARSTENTVPEKKEPTPNPTGTA